MCNLGEEIYKKGIQQGIYKSIKNMIKNFGVTFDEAVMALEVDESKVEQYRKQYELEMK